MNKNLKILLVISLVVVAMLLLGWVLPIALNILYFTPYLKSIIILVIFILLVLQKRYTWESNVVFAIAVFSIVGMLFDTAGNPIYNKPLELIVSSIGELEIKTQVSHYIPGEYSVSERFQVIKQDGEVVEFNGLFLHLYRFVQYLIVYAILAMLLESVIEMMPNKDLIKGFEKEEKISPEIKQKIEQEQSKRTHEEEKRRIVPEEIKESLFELKQNKDSIKAIKLIREHTNLSIEEAKKFLEEL